MKEKSIFISETCTEKMAIINFLLLNKKRNLPRKVAQVSPFINHMKLIYGGEDLIESDIVFPFKNIPYNHPDGFKKATYKRYDYTVVAPDNVATFGYPRPKYENRLHAARDLYYDHGEPIYAMADSIVQSVSGYFRKTKQMTIEHEYEIKKGYKMVIRYAEIKNPLFKAGQKVKKGEKI